MYTANDRRHTIAICDSQPLIVEGLRGLLENSDRYELLEASRTLEALTHLIATASPSVVIVDKAVGGTGMIDWLTRARENENLSVIVWGASISDAEGLRLLQAGARGILRKTAHPDNLMACLDSVASGATWMDDSLFRNVAATGDASFRPDLTPREQQVLHLVEQGLRNKEIASELGIRPGTVKIHLKHIFEKSGVRGRYGLALSGLRERAGLTAMTA